MTSNDSKLARELAAELINGGCYEDARAVLACKRCGSYGPERKCPDCPDWPYREREQQ